MALHYRRSPASLPQGYFVGSAVFHYLGPSFAVLLFARVDVLGVAWLRIASAASSSPLWRRPWRTFSRSSERTGSDRRARLRLCRDERLLLLAIDRLPLATVAAIEFIGPIVLAALGARTARNVAAVLAAAAASTC